jgi:uncharacterized alkaline shock family protein YloU
VKPKPVEEIILSNPRRGMAQLQEDSMAKDNDAPTMDDNPGTVRIAPGVLATIARLTTLAIPGVSRLSPQSYGVGSLWSGKNPNSGVKIDLVEDAVVIDINIVAQPNAELLPLSREIQTQVTRAVHDMVGMPVRAVNVYVRDIERTNAAP